MPFSNFLLKCQKMFNYLSSQVKATLKRWFLFVKVQNAKLKATVEALKLLVSLDADLYNFRWQQIISLRKSSHGQLVS